MNLEIYAIKDTVVGAFLNPFLQHNDAECIRTAEMAANSHENTSLKENAKDKQLWKLGTFNDVTGEITSNVEHLRNVIDLVKQKKEN